SRRRVRGTSGRADGRVQHRAGAQGAMRHRRAPRRKKVVAVDCAKTSNTHGEPMARLLQGSRAAPVQGSTGGATPRGQYIMTQTPTRAIVAPTTSARSGRLPSKAQPHNSDSTMKKPP